jgi:hypothetical protein
VDDEDVTNDKPPGKNKNDVPPGPGRRRSAGSRGTAGGEIDRYRFTDLQIYIKRLAGLASRGPPSSRGCFGSLALPFAGATRPCAGRARTSRRVRLAGLQCAISPGPRLRLFRSVSRPVCGLGCGRLVRLRFALRSLAVWHVRAIAPSFVSGWRAFSSVSLCKSLFTAEPKTPNPHTGRKAAGMHRSEGEPGIGCLRTRAERRPAGPPVCEVLAVREAPPTERRAQHSGGSRGWQEWRQLRAPVRVPPRPGQPGKCSRGQGGGRLGPRSCGVIAQQGSGREQSRHGAKGRRPRGRCPESPRGGDNPASAALGGACIRQGTGEEGEKVGHGVPDCLGRLRGRNPRGRG